MVVGVGVTVGVFVGVAVLVGVVVGVAVLVGVTVGVTVLVGVTVGVTVGVGVAEGCITLKDAVLRHSGSWFVTNIDVNGNDNPYTVYPNVISFLDMLDANNVGTDTLSL